MDSNELFYTLSNFSYQFFSSFAYVLACGFLVMGIVYLQSFFDSKSNCIKLLDVFFGHWRHRLMCVRCSLVPAQPISPTPCIGRVHGMWHLCVAQSNGHVDVMHWQQWLFLLYVVALLADLKRKIRGNSFSLYAFVDNPISNFPSRCTIEMAELEEGAPKNDWIKKA